MNPDLKSNRLLKINVDALLTARHLTRKDLAQWCYKSESWISKIFKEDRREFAVSQLDRIADFFGLATYQLFQPGIARVTERRRGERRANRERRIAHAGRMAAALQSEVNKFPRLARRTDYDFGSLPAAIQTIIEKADRDIAAYQEKNARGQTPSSRGHVTEEPAARRSRRRPPAEAS